MRLEMYWNWSSSQSCTHLSAVIFSMSGNGGDSFQGAHWGIPQHKGFNYKLVHGDGLAPCSSDLCVWLAWLAGCLRVAKHMQGWQHTDSWGSLKKLRRRNISVDRRWSQSHTRRESLDWLNACDFWKVLGKKYTFFHFGESVMSRMIKTWTWFFWYYYYYYLPFCIASFTNGLK